MLFIVCFYRKFYRFEVDGKARTPFLAIIPVGWKKCDFCDKKVVTINHGRYDGERKQLQALSCQAGTIIRPILSRALLCRE
jgi:hypothetical protein